jgi:hypothetical protein
MIAVARERGVNHLTGLVLRENAPMLRLTASLSFGAPKAVEEAVVRVGMELG